MINQWNKLNMCETWMRTDSLSWFQNVAEQKLLYHSWCQQISHVRPVTQELFPDSTVKYDNVAEAANTHNQRKNWRVAWLLLRKTSWNASASTADLSTAETSSEAKPWKWTMWTFTCFQTQVSIKKRKCLTLCPLTNVTEGVLSGQLLLQSSLQQTIQPVVLFFLSQSFTGLCCTILRLNLCSSTDVSAADRTSMAATLTPFSTLSVLKNKVRHARLETLSLM